MRAGDVLLFSRKSGWREDPLGTFFCKLIQFATRSKWNHAALAVSETHYIEATAQGVRLTSGFLLRTLFDTQVVIEDPIYATEQDRQSAVAWAMAREGVSYGYLNAVMCGVNNILVGLGLVIKRTDAIICSELVAEALERAGADFGKDSATVSPGDLADFIGVPR